MQTCCLLLKKSLFRRHDFSALYIDSIISIRSYFFSTCRFFQLIGMATMHKSDNIPNQFHFYGGEKALIFSSDELLPYALTNLHVQQYQFLQCVKKDNKQSIVLGDGDMLCSVPLNILTLKLILETANKLASLHTLQAMANGSDLNMENNI